ncbi:MAG: hypothetical protein QN158_01890 [Armatimonadota bacterium]|nr:hypothetical protein [Armatimonadota bacterium]MDR7458431.1 hypothetical protein [Armatimonadota bacterium]MDR7478767.1 hypothetical protein [Armatimonadota bacterium]MDR7488225.1 hypothetical protein [Armatimonadota bacterium]MDR7501410.1 hypothetical protein [Armatimonadota bacterium]
MPLPEGSPQPAPSAVEGAPAPGDLRIRIRAAILDFLARHQETQVPTLLDALARQFPGFGRAEETVALEVLHELATSNILLPALDRRHLGWPWVRVTEYGRQVLQTGRPVPYDPDRYLAAAQQRLPTLPPLVLDVLRESVAAFHRGLIRASALLLGVASELLMLELTEAFLATLPEAERRSLSEWWAEKSLYARYRLFREAFEARREALALPDSVSKDIDAILDLVFNAVRLQRNEAGHPTGAPLNPVLMAATLQVFLEYAERITGLIAFLRQTTVRPPSRRRRRRTRSSRGE